MIQLLRGTQQQLNSYSTIIPDGQPVFEKDTGQLKIGNGASMYSALPYVGASGGSEYPKIHVEYSELDSNYFKGYVDFNDKLRYLFGICNYDMGNMNQFESWYVNVGSDGLPDSDSYKFGTPKSTGALNIGSIPFSKGKIIGGQVNPLSSTGNNAVWFTCQAITNQYREEYATSLRAIPLGSVSAANINRNFLIRYDIWCLDILSTDVPYDSSNS